jgi:hypothetical protein
MHIDFTLWFPTFKQYKNTPIILLQVRGTGNYFHPLLTSYLKNHNDFRNKQSRDTIWALSLEM